MSVGAMFSNFGICLPPRARASHFPWLYHGLCAGVNSARGPLAFWESTRHRRLSKAMLVAGVLLSSQPSAAVVFEGKCLLEVSGTSYLDGPCNIDLNVE